MKIPRSIAMGATLLSVLFSCKPQETQIIPVASISINPTSLTLEEGETSNISATVSPSNATDKAVTWSSSSNAVATIKEGVVTAVKEGSATITAKAGGKTAVCEVKVHAKFVAVTSITLDQTSLDLKEGETATLTATVKPDNATDKAVAWTSSNDKVATVKDGKVTAVKEGTATITATAGDKKATCKVTVEKNFVEVTSITLDKTTLTVTAGEEETLTATVKPDDATDKTVTWTSSNTAIATVKDGKVKGIKAGTATITAQAGDKKATCKVVVTKSVIEVTSITLDKTTLSLTVGAEETLTATVKPDNATDKTVTWTSSNTAIATVKDGKVKGVKAGTATITAKAGSKTATCKVTVTKATIAVTSITLNKTTLSLTVGAEETLTATVKPDNATDKTVTWTSSNTAIATVKDGKVKGIKEGTATITAKAGDKTATCKVTVSKATVAVTSVTLNKTSLSLKVNQEETLIATVKPDNATDKTVKWSSSNTSVATVNNGKVKGIKAGTAVITAKAGDKSAKCNVTVTADPVPTIHFGQSSAEIAGAMSMNYGSVSFTIENAPSDAFPEVTSSDDSWLHIESFSSSSVTYWASKNTGSSTRTGTLTFKYKNAEPQKFTVKQYAASYCQLIINETTREVSRDAATYKIDYTLTHPLDGYGFKFKTDPKVNWLTADYKDGIITFTVTKNTSSESRSCRLQVLYEAAESPVWISITQLGETAGPDIDVQNHDEGYILVDEDGEDCCLFFCQIVNPISGVTLTAKADVDWITNIRKYNDSFYCFTALPNDTGAIRYGHIDLTYSTAHKKLTFQQAPNGDIITLSPESMTVNYQGRTISFTVNLKEGFDPKNLKVSEESVTGFVKNLKISGNKVTFDVLENNSGHARETGILVEYGSQSRTFHLTQTYEAPSFTVSPTSLNLNYARQESLINVQITNPRERLSLTALEVNDTNWLSCYVKDGVVHINVTENNTGSARKSAVEIGYNSLGGKVQVQVTQKRATTALVISPSIISCGANGTTQAINITVQDPLEGVNVTATPADSWIKINSLSNTSASVTVDKNLTGSSRQSSIKFTYGNLVGTVTVKQEGESVPDGFVDLGLTSGTLWATCNLGANAEQDLGNFYAWGETATKSQYTWDNYKWGQKNNLTKYNATDKKSTLETADDPAYQKNNAWSMPTRAQFDELQSECDWQWVTAPVPGYKVKARSGGSYIFLPAGGYKGYGWQDDPVGYYWSKNLYTSERKWAYLLGFTEDSWFTDKMERCNGMLVRPVINK